MCEEVPVQVDECEGEFTESKHYFEWSENIRPEQRCACGKYNVEDIQKKGFPITAI